MGKEGIIPEHPTLKLKYQDEEMAKLALELREQLEAEREKEHDGGGIADTHWDRVSDHPNISTVEIPASYHNEPRKPK